VPPQNSGKLTVNRRTPYPLSL